DVLAVTGNAALGGTLEVVGAFVPGIQLLTAGAVSGHWAAITAPAGYGLTYGAKNFTLCATGAAGCEPLPVATASPTPAPTPSPRPATPAAPAPGGSRSPSESQSSAKPTPNPFVFPSRCTQRLKLRFTGAIAKVTITINGKRVKVVRKAGTVTLRM